MNRDIRNERVPRFSFSGRLRPYDTPILLPHMNNAPAGALHHVELYVSDLPASIAFWGWLLGQLGYREYQQWEEGISWESGHTYLVLVQTRDEHQQPPYHRCRTGLNHLAFHAGTRADVDRLTHELQQRGYRLLYEDRHPHAGGGTSYTAFFEDPDRIKVELVAGGRYSCSISRSGNSPHSTAGTG